MSILAGPLSRIRRRLHSLSIRSKITIGNTAVIVIGAVGGTLLTHHFAGQAGDLWLILLFACLGILVSISLNYLIIRSALRPLQDLRQTVDSMQQATQLQATGTRLEALELEGSDLGSDPDIGQLATALRSLLNQVETSNRRLRSLSERAINAQEEERKRIAQSLHDDTGQALSTLIIQLERLEKRTPVTSDEDADARLKLANARQLASSTLNELRKIVHGLRPSILDDLGLGPAIRWYARSNLEEAGIQAEIDVPEEPIPMPAELNTTLFRITQEAINNIVRHSQAQKAAISLNQKDGEAYLSIQDDGRGFEASQIQGQPIRVDRWGLVGIQERVDMVGGSFQVTSTPGQGTRLEVSVPLPTPQEAPGG